MSDSDDLLAATSGTKICPRCAEEIKAAATMCRFCGYELAGAVSVTAPQTPEPLTPDVKPGGIAVPVDVGVAPIETGGRVGPRVAFALSARGWAVSVVLLIDAIVNAGLFVGRLNEANLIRRVIAETPVSDAELTSSDAFINPLASAHGFLFLLAAIAFLIWIYSANKRAHALGSEGMQFSPRASALWFFAPFANFIVPFRAVREIWKVSDPAVDRSDPTAWQRAPRSWLIVVWWIGWIGSNLASRAVPTSYTGKESLQRLLEISTTAGWLSAAIGVSALLACAVVVLIESRLSAAEGLPVETWGTQLPGTYAGRSGEIYRLRVDANGSSVVERRSMDGGWTYAPALAIRGLNRISD